MTTRIESLPIRTPEGIEFTLPLAGPVSRMLAFAIDLCVIATGGAVLQTVLGPLRLLSEDALQAVGVALYFVVSLLYGILTEWLWHGQTIGKRLLGLRVMEASGLRLKPAQVIVRNLLRFVDMLPAFYLLGGAACLLSSRRQRLGDLAAGTIVIRTPDLREPDVAQLLGGKFNSLAVHRHLAARLRQKTPPALARLALEALLRRDELDPQSRLELFREFAAHFKSQVAFPIEVVEQLSDEQYVRDVVDVIFRKAPAKQGLSAGSDFLRGGPSGPRRDSPPGWSSTGPPV